MDGRKLILEYDTKDTHPYDELDFLKGADGKVTAAQVTLDPNVLATGMSVGQIFGSALGGALGGNSLVGNLASSTIGGLIGQKFVQVLATSMTADLSTISLNDVFAGQGINVANAGIGAISSFLTAELGHALKIGGFDGQLFDTAVSGFTTSLLTQVTDKMVRGSLDFAGAIAAMDWSQAVSGAIDVAEINLGNLLGGYLGHELVPAQTREGAIGGQLFGAIGGFILPGGLGSLIGTIIGTLIFNHFGTQPSPGAVELLDQAGYFYGRSDYQSSDGGGYEISQKMATAADDIVNAYLHAVDGAALDHSKQVTLGYIKNPDLLFISGSPGHTNHSFTSADDAVHFAALDVLQNLEVIGGDLLMKRAHQNSPSNIPEAGPAGGGMPGQSQVSGADQLATLAGDLSVAQDYENYLNNREAINALIAANPDSSFTAGWIATFARVNDLGLNHYGASDFLGGLVGYLDSVKKAGLTFDAAGVSFNHDGDNVTVSVKAPNGTDIPGALSVFADQTNVSSDATGTTVQFAFTDGFAASGFHPVIGSGDSGNDWWFGGDGGNIFDASGSKNAILVGGAGNDTLTGGNGWDFIDGGAGDDTLVGGGGVDILRGGKGLDYLFGGGGNDTYAFNRGDGVDVMLDDVTVTTTSSQWVDWYEDQGGINILHHDWVTTTTTDHPNAGTDSLEFGVGIGLSDIEVRPSDDGTGLIVGVKDPAHPGYTFTQLADTIVLRHWFDDGLDRIENFRFADGTTLDLSAGQSAITALQVPFGAALSGGRVDEHSANGTVVGTVAGFDWSPDVALTYSLADSAGGRFAINAATGVITVANGALLDYATAASHAITVRTADSSGHSFDKPFSIAVTDVPNHAPVLTVPAGNIRVSVGQSLQVSTLFSAADADNDAMGYYFQDDPAPNSGHFVLNGTAIANGAYLGVSAADLAHLTFVAGANGATDDLSIHLTDGHDVSATAHLHINVNHAPVATVAAGVRLNAGQQVAVSSLFSAADADGDAMGYYIQDGGAANSGHLFWNGTDLGNAAYVGVSAADLANVTYVAGADGGADDLSIHLTDSRSVSATVQLHVNVNHAPVLTAPAAVTLNAGQAVAVSSLFSAADADGDAMSYYIQDGNAPNSGHLFWNGTDVGNGAYVGVSAADLAGVTYVPGSAADDLSIHLSDGRTVSATSQLHINVNHAPVLTAPAAVTLNAGQAVAISSLFSAADPDGDAMGYYIQDGNAANSGHLFLNGTDFGNGAYIGVGAADLANLTYVPGSAADDLSIHLSDGRTVSATSQLHINVNHAPVVTVPAGTVTVIAGQSVQLSTLFSAADPDGDAMGYYIQDDPAPNSGHLVLNGTAYPNGTYLGVSAADLANLTFVAGADGVTDDLSIHLSDGHMVSATAHLHIEGWHV